MTSLSPNGHDQNALPLSPKRRMEDEGLDLDSALNPAKHYPRKRVAVAVGRIACHAEMELTNLSSAKCVDCERRNVMRRDLVASVQMLASNVYTGKMEAPIRSMPQLSYCGCR